MSSIFTVGGLYSQHGHGDYMSALASEPTYMNGSMLINNQLVKVPFEARNIWSESQWSKSATCEKGISSEKRKLILSSIDSKTLPTTATTTTTSMTSTSSPENEYASIDDAVKMNYDVNRESFMSMSTFIPTLSNVVNGASPEPYATTDILMSNRNSSNSSCSGNNNSNNTNGNNSSTVNNASAYAVSVFSII